MDKKKEIMTAHEFMLAINMLLCLIYIGLAKLFDSGNYDVTAIVIVLCLGLVGFVSTKSIDFYYQNELEKELDKLHLKNEQNIDIDNTEAQRWEIS